MTASLFAAPYNYFTDENGAPLAGGKVYTYSAGTTTPKATYTDYTGVTPLSNPVVLDSAGRAEIWGTGSYKLEVTDSSGAPIYTTDNVSPSSSSGDMTKAVYDPASINEQLVGLTAVQNLTNKTINFGQSTLSHYDEDVWTPTIIAGTTPGTPTYSAQVGSYERIGRQVRASFKITLSGWTGSPAGSIQIGGLPFTSNNTANDVTVNAMAYSGITGLAASYYGMICLSDTNATTASVFSSTTNGVSPVTAAQLGTTPTLYGNIIYHV